MVCSAPIDQVGTTEDTSSFQNDETAISIVVEVLAADVIVMDSVADDENDGKNARIILTCEALCAIHMQGLSLWCQASESQPFTGGLSQQS